MDTIESPLREDEEEQIPDAFLNVILSFNQHFTGEDMTVCGYEGVGVRFLCH